MRTGWVRGVRGYAPWHAATSDSNTLARKYSGRQVPRTSLAALALVARVACLAAAFRLLIRVTRTAEARARRCSHRFCDCVHVPCLLARAPATRANLAKIEYAARLGNVSMYFNNEVNVILHAES